MAPKDAAWASVGCGCQGAVAARLWIVNPDFDTAGCNSEIGIKHTKGEVIRPMRGYNNTFGAYINELAPILINYEYEKKFNYYNNRTDDFQL